MPTTTWATSSTGLWLDPSMTYSSALYEGEVEKPLEAAQIAKYERILSQLGARQGDSILEIGCGWGGFAEVAARRGMRVTGVTISREQLDYARARLERAGLADRVDLQFRDYRDIEGQYDHIVSIEMIEAVGERYWPDYFATLKRHVVPGGSAIVQAIVIADDFFERYRKHPEFIQTYVFPGGMLLSPSSLREQCRQAGLKVAELYSFGLDYARTLETWAGPLRRGGRAGRPHGLRRAFPPNVAVLPRLLCRRLLDAPHGRFAGTLQAYITVGNQ